MLRHYVDPNLNSGRYSEPEELEEDYTEISYTDDSGPRAAGLGIEVRQNADGKVTGALVDGGDTNTIVVSATGAGKTRRVLSQYILSCVCAAQSFVVHDPKGEIYSFFCRLLEEKGFIIKVINLREPMKGDRLNFLQEAAVLWREGKKGRALEIVRQLGVILYTPVEDQKDKFWTETSINLFLCYFTVAATIYEPDYVTLGTIYKLHIEGIEKVNGQMAMMTYLEAHQDEMSYELGMPSYTAPHDTRQSIFSVFTNGLVRVILNDEIADLTTKSTVSVNDLATGEKPMALFIITRDEAPLTYSTVVASFVDMIYTKLIDLAQQEEGGRLPRTVHFILEEFGNIAKLENINDMMTASRSRGIRMVVVLQSLCQLYMTYTRELAHVLIGNSQNLVFMSSTDMELVKMVSERCGTMIDPYTNERTELLSPDRLTHLSKKNGETLMLLDRHYPYITSLPDLSMYEMIRPVKNVRFPEREKVKVEYGLLRKLAEDIYDQKQNASMERYRKEAEESKQRGQTSRQKMTEFPPALRTILDGVICGGQEVS